MVKDATENTARVELHSTCQTISVDRSHIANVGVPTKDGGFSSYTRTPAYTAGSQTPMYARDGSKTPMHGSQTPMYESKYTTNYFKNRFFYEQFFVILTVFVLYYRWLENSALRFDDTVPRRFAYARTVRSMGSDRDQYTCQDERLRCLQYGRGWLAGLCTRLSIDRRTIYAPDTGNHVRLGAELQSVSAESQSRGERHCQPQSSRLRSDPVAVGNRLHDQSPRGIRYSVADGLQSHDTG